MRPPTKVESTAAELGHPPFDDLVAFSLNQLGDSGSGRPFIYGGRTQCQLKYDARVELCSVLQQTSLVQT